MKLRPANRFDFRQSVCRRAGHGFTLVEIMITIALIALFMAWGVPNVIRTLRKDAMQQSVSDVMEACSHARARAILSGVPMVVVLRAEDGHINVEPLPGHDRPSPRPSGLTSNDGGGEQGDQGQSPATGMRPISLQLDDSVAVELLDVNFRDHMKAAEARVRFFPNGTSDEFAIVLRSGSGQVSKISLDVVTGTAELEDIR